MSSGDDRHTPHAARVVFSHCGTQSDRTCLTKLHLIIRTNVIFATSIKYCNSSNLNMAEKHVEVEGINYYTLFELPDSQDKTAPCVLLIHALMSNLHMYVKPTGIVVVQYLEHSLTLQPHNLGTMLQSRHSMQLVIVHSDMTMLATITPQHHKTPPRNDACLSAANSHITWMT
jgi:hypothetical protein